MLYSCFLKLIVLLSIAAFLHVLLQKSCCLKRPLWGKPGDVHPRYSGS